MAQYMRRQTRIPPYLWVLALAMISCNVSTLLAPAPSLTPTPTTAQPTFTPTAMPSPTPLPDTPSLTPTLAVTESPEEQLSCRVMSQSIKNGSHFGPREDFDMGWLVRNTGSADWDASSMEFTYFSGTKMYLFSPVHLDANVEHGEKVALSASLVAPKNSGTYRTVWALRQGTYYFCYVSIRIIVP